MTYTSTMRIARQAVGSSRILATALLAIVFCATVQQPAQAQSADTWKSVAIIGGSTAAGAYVGHKVAGARGAWIGAGVGAAGGYAIDKKRRDNEYNNDYYGYGNSPYYGNNGYYDSGNSGYYGNGNNNNGYYGDDNNGHYGNSADYGNQRQSRNPNGYYRGSDGMYYPR